ncbi:hypothetical protein NUW58_g4671 [Xylaria curta]|uniref:Uncharacterized protein n=1 Tax=Xylaria curta TaxID=42375 RepID=A0ACC1P5U1_9PEZI|nr:hypothetical protein NUW58_g4671 [Xylaria curta]
MSDTIAGDIAKGILPFNLVSGRVANILCTFAQAQLARPGVTVACASQESSPVANADVKAPDTTESLPPISKEPAATADASMVPSVPVDSTTADAPAAPSSDTASKPEAPVEAEAKEDSGNKPSESDISAAQPEKTSDSDPAPETQPITTETAVSGVESSAPAGPNDEAVEPPKPASVEEIRDEDLPNEKPSDTKKPTEEAPKVDAIDNDATGPVTTTGGEATEASPVDSTSAENGNVVAGNKRKVGAVEDAVESGADTTKNKATEPPEKKLKANGTNGATTNGAARKPGRPKKEKRLAAPVGKTARKTRSQGTAD